MKKYIILLFLSAISMEGVIVAQPPVLIYNGRELSQNEVITVSDINPITGYMQFMLSVKNSASKAVTVKVKRTEISIIEGSENYFCFGSCYEPSVSESESKVIQAGETLPNFFYADYEPSSQKGTSRISYAFYDISDVKNSMNVTVHFSDGSTRIESFSAENVKIYSSAKNRISIVYNLQEKQELIIRDLTGKVVGKQFLNTGKATEELPFFLRQGIYIYSLQGVNGALSGKIIVR